MAYIKCVSNGGTDFEIPVALTGEGIKAGTSFTITPNTWFSGWYIVGNKYSTITASRVVSSHHFYLWDKDFNSLSESTAQSVDISNAYFVMYAGNDTSSSGITYTIS